MINKYWDLSDTNLASNVASQPGDLICYGVPPTGNIC